MKTNKIIFWVCTGIVSVMMLSSAYFYFTSPDVKAAIEHLGFPDYFRVELGAAKFLGAVALLLPVVPYKLKLFAYYGFTINFISAFIAHMASGDPLSTAITPLVVLAFLTGSYIYYHKMKGLSAV